MRVRGIAAGVLVGVALALSAAGVAFANATFTWQGGAGSTNWGEAGNWQGGKAPAPADGTVDLEFPLAACRPWPALCPSTLNDVTGLTVGELTLDARVIRWTPKEPLELPPFEPHPESYSIGGGQALKLAGGIDALTSEEGTGEGEISTGGTYVNVPLELVADNAWSAGPAPGATLAVEGPITGVHPLSVGLARDASLQLGGTAEVGPVTITGGLYAYVTISGAGGAGDLNGSDGQPVRISGATFSGAGSIGPLTLEGVFLSVGSHAAGGVLEVSGSLSLDGSTQGEFVVPGPSSFSVPSELQVAGSASLGGAHLLVAERCPAPGTSFTLVHAQGGVSGRFTNLGGAVIESGQVLAGQPDSCGQGAPGPPLRIDYSADDVTATVLAPPPRLPAESGSPPGPSTGSTTGTAGLAPLGAVSRALLAGDLRAARTGESIGRLLRGGGETIRVHAGQPGELTLEWTESVGGRRHPPPVIIARGTTSFGRAGAGKLRLHLTRRGRTLLEHSRRVGVTVRERFTAAGFQPFGLEARLTLRR